MTAATPTNTDALHEGTHQPEAANSRTAGALTLRQVVRSELTKLHSLRSMVIGLVIAAVLIIGVGVLMSIGIIAQDPSPAAPGENAVNDPTGASLSGVGWAMFVVAALGVVAVTSEYATGSIQVTFAAVPRRSLVVVGKTLALASVLGIVTVASTLSAFLGAKAVLATSGLSISLTEPGVARVVIGSGLYLTGVGLMAAGFGWLLRNTAGALAALLGVLVILPAVGLFLPPAARDAVVPYLPNNAGTAVMQLTPGGMLPPWTGFGVFCLYTAAVLTAAVLLVGRRDT